MLYPQTCGMIFRKRGIMNKAILMGRLTKDPEIRYTQSNLAVVTFTLAVDRRMSREKKEQAEQNGGQTADFIRCQAFGKTAEMIDRHFSKGRKIVIEGHIQTGSYDDKNGRKVYTTDVVVDHFYFPESAQNQGGYQNQGNYQQSGYQQNYQKPQQNYQQQSNYQQPQQQNYQQMNMNDEIPSGYMEIDESDIPL